MDANGYMLTATFVTEEAGTLLRPRVWLVF